MSTHTGIGLGVRKRELETEVSLITTYKEDMPRKRIKIPASNFFSKKEGTAQSG
jgi:hypothetical protein